MPAALPTISNVRLILRVLAHVASGVRRPRALAELLGTETRDVQATLDTAEWLGLLTQEADAELTPIGLSCLYASNRRSAWAEAVRQHPVVGPLALRPPDQLVEDLAAVVAQAEPGLDRPSSRRKVRTLVRLVEPSLRAPPTPLGGRQLGLDFAASPVPRRPHLELRGDTDDSLDAHTYTLRLLLDHGELTPGMFRGSLDSVGGTSCGLGGYLAALVQRGDAVRQGDALLVTRGAVERRALAESPVTVALSNRELRAWLVPFLEGRVGVAQRYWAWLARLLPEPLPRTLDESSRARIKAGLDRLLFGRPVTSLPLAGDVGVPITGPGEPFLRAATRRGIAFAIPSNLLLLSGGLTAINRALRTSTLEASPVRPPHPVDRRLLVHGGLLYPKEPPPRSIPDGVTLRLRATANIPAFAILAALGALERRGTVRLRARGEGLVVEGPGRRPRPIADLVEQLADAREWIYVRGPNSARWEDLVTLSEQLGVLTRLGSRWTLEETWFHRLQTDPEHHDVWEGLQPLAELLLDRCASPLAG